MTVFLLHSILLSLFLLFLPPPPLPSCPLPSPSSPLLSPSLPLLHAALKDYSSIQYSVSISPNEVRELQFTFYIHDDDIAEPCEETFSIRIFSTSPFVRIPGQSCVPVVILDDDGECGDRVCQSTHIRIMCLLESLSVCLSVCMSVCVSVFGAVYVCVCVVSSFGSTPLSISLLCPQTQWSVSLVVL